MKGNATPLRVRLRPLLSALLTLATLLPMTHAQTDRSRPPVPGPPPEVQVGEHVTFFLRSGMRVIVVEDHKLPLVSVQVRFDHRPFLERDHAGYTDLAGELLAAGTASYAKLALDERIDALGAKLYTDKEGVFATSLTDRFPELFTLVEEVVLRPTFPQEEFDKAKLRLLSAVKQRSEDPDAIADQVARVFTYSKAHPYGEVVTEETVAAIHREQVVAYHRHFFRPDRGFLVFVGDIDPEQARALCEGAFSDWQRPQDARRDAEGFEVVEALGQIRTPVPKPLPTLPRRVVIVDRPGAVQSVLRVCGPVELQPTDPEAPAAQVMNTILGGGVFNARLMQNLRENKGYTYGISSALRSDRELGAFTVSTSVRTEVTDSALTEIMVETEHLPLMPVKEEELRLAKNHLAGQFIRSLEDPRTRARYALNIYLYGLRPDHYQTYLSRLDAVTAEDVQRVAERLLRADHLVMVVVGDRDRVGNRLLALGFDGQLHPVDEHGDPFREELIPPPADLTVDSVLERYVEARGGRDRLARVKDVHLRYRSSMMNLPITLDEWYQVPGAYAMRMDLAGRTGEAIAVRNGKGKQLGPMGVRELGELEQATLDLDVLPFPELALTQHGRFVLVGSTRVGGRMAYKVAGELDSGGSRTEFYDVESGLLLRRVESRTTEERGSFTLITDLGDYRPVSGILFPHRVEQTAGQNLVFEAELIEVDKGVARSVFDLE